jgi:hypothetical protein
MRVPQSGAGRRRRAITLRRATFLTALSPEPN